MGLNWKKLLANELVRLLIFGAVAVVVYFWIKNKGDPAKGAASTAAAVASAVPMM